MVEAGLVFDTHGDLIHWHLPLDRSSVSLPDSRDLWEVLWRNRAILGGVAHTHPWNGPADPSHTDVTTFAAVETGLGQRLVWPIVTFSEVQYFVWVGPRRADYDVMEMRRFRLNPELVGHLRAVSKQEGSK